MMAPGRAGWRRREYCLHHATPGQKRLLVLHMTLLPYALDAARRGFYLFPVEPGGKTPGRMYPDRPVSEAPWTLRWSEVATNHIPTIIQWWNAEPRYNIGIAVKPSGLIVVDCDVSPSYDGYLQFVDLASEYDPEWYLKETYMVRTGGGGLHIYWKWPASIQASQSGFCPNVDIRSNGGQRGGYVLAAGSITTKGAYAVEEDHPIANAPSWVIELARERPRPAVERPRFAQPGSVSFAGLQTAVAVAVESNRNQVCFWAARSMCEDGASLDQAIDLLVPAASTAGLPERETIATIRSAYRLQSGKR